VAKQYTVRRLKIGRTEQMDTLAGAAGDLYSRTVTSFWRVVRRKAVWLRPKHVMRWHTSGALHAHSADACVQSFFAALESWRRRRTEDPAAHPPRRRKRYYRVQWKASAIRVKDGLLHLSNGKGNAPLVVPWDATHGVPSQVEMGWDGHQYELRATYTATVEAPLPASDGTVAGVDLGEVHPAVAHDGARAIIMNGRHLRAVRRYQNKTTGTLQALLARKKKGSRRWRRLVRSKKTQQRRWEHQVKDIAHKITSHLVSTLHKRGVQTVAIGDIRMIRQRTAVGHTGNQRLHQMPSGMIRHMLTYKGERLGLAVALQDERFTTQECPACGARSKPRGRAYHCRVCGFTAHRDGVGAWNIRQKYRGALPVVGLMAWPTLGVRYHAHLARSPLPPGWRERTPAH
jgi:putative transposase